jgi:hypothetical protein
MGGELWIGADGEPLAITLPSVQTYAQANYYVFGDVYRNFNPIPMVLAIKAERTIKDDAAATGQVHDSDSDAR